MSVSKFLRISALVLGHKVGILTSPLILLHKGQTMRKTLFIVVQTPALIERGQQYHGEVTQRLGRLLDVCDDPLRSSWDTRSSMHSTDSI